MDYSFGYKNVSAEQKQSLVGQVFSSVASKYDIMNDVMSGGMHRLWKKQMINELELSPTDTYLDVAGGTGDIGFAALKKCAKVTINDINPDMLAEGKNRAIDKNLIHNIEWVEANAEKLPFKDNSYNKTGIAFGIRNVTHIQQALHEFYRILKPGGKFVCLEFGEVENEAVKKLYDFYSFKIIPQMGQLIAGDKDSYQYLAESIRKFPPRSEFTSMMQNAGFTEIKAAPHTFGVVTIFSGYKSDA